MSSGLTFPELILLAMACLAPWAFGSVDAWAELILALEIALLGILTVFSGRGLGPLRRLYCLSSLGLVGVAVLGLAQTIPLSSSLLGWLDPAAAASFVDLLPPRPEVVLGDPAAPVAFPPRTLSVEPGLTFHSAVRLAAAWVLFQGVLGLPSGFASLRRVGLVMVSNATLMALVGLVQALTWNGKLLWVRPLTNGNAYSSGGPFASHSHYAEYLNLGLGFAFGSLLALAQDALLHGSHSRLSRGGYPARLLDRFRGPNGGGLWAAYAAGVLMVGIITSHSRGGVLAMIVATLTLLVMLSLRSGRLAVWIRIIFTLSVILAMSALFLTVVGDNLRYQDRLATMLTSEGYTDRLVLWGGALKAWREHPVWGSGLGSFAAATAPFLDVDLGVIFARGENEYIELLTEGGLLGLALGLAFLLGIGRMAIRALANAPSARDRGFVAGAMFGLLALAFHSLSDFGPHIPGVGIPALILAGHLVRLGLALPEPAIGPAVVPPFRRIMNMLVLSCPAVLGLVVATRFIAPFQVESIIAGSGLPLPGSSSPSPRILDLTQAQFEPMRTALEASLRIQPDWAEGHIRLGQTYLGLYQASSAELIGSELNDPPQTEIMASPLWLLGLAKDDKTGQSAALIQELLEQEPIRRYLVPAAHSFLQARRCRRVSAHAQVGLASLSYLLEHGDPSAAYLRRAMRLAGSNGELLRYSALIAAQVDDPGLVGRISRRGLEVSDENWSDLADLCGTLLTPQQILDDVIPSGRSALWFAQRLYSGFFNRSARELFLREAVNRLPGDRISEADRLCLQAQAQAGLNNREKARALMRDALIKEPGRVIWRNLLIDWLLAWGEAREAHDLALIGLLYSPDDPAAKQALERTTEALARGDTPKEAPSRAP